MQVVFDKTMIDAWQRLNNASMAILVAQPAGMSEAAKELAQARIALETMVMRAVTTWVAVGATPQDGLSKVPQPNSPEFTLTSPEK